MADIFISYATPDRESAKALAAHLEELGYSCWWDREISAGKEFSVVIEEEMAKAKVVLVLWSAHANKSRWVRDEAIEGLEQGKLIPAFIENVKPPLGFRQIQARILYDGDRINQASGFEKLVDDLHAKISTKEQAETSGVAMKTVSKSPAEKQPPATVSPTQYDSSPVSEKITSAFSMKNPATFLILGVVLIGVVAAALILFFQMNNVKYKPGEVFFRDKFLDDSGEGPQMVVIPAGRFTMGDIRSSGEENERPVHEVVISKPYALSVYEVSFKEYKRFVNKTQSKSPSDEGWGDDDRPVINVSWKDALAYAEWLSQQTGHTYRLPSEAEWEYAARAGTETDYWWGNDTGKNNANCDGCGSQWDKKQTAPVHSFNPNEFGLYNTAGNVWEWVQDCWHENYDGAPKDGNAWESSGDCNIRVLRGGSWWNKDPIVRSYRRAKIGLGFSTNSYGIRLARTLNNEKFPSGRKQK